MNFIRNILLLAIAFTRFNSVYSQAIVSTPTLPVTTEEVILRVDISKCSNKALLDYEGDVYVHTGVLTSLSTGSSDWRYVNMSWGENAPEYKCVRVSANVYDFTISPSIEGFYNIPSNELVASIAIVFRSEESDMQTEDLFVNVDDDGMIISWVTPSGGIIVQPGDEINIIAQTVSLETPPSDSIVLYVDNVLTHISKHDTINHTITASGIGTHWIKLTADNVDFNISDSIFYFIQDDAPIIDLPEGLEDGINYINNNTVTFVLYAPNKESVFLIGDFNNWTLYNNFILNKTPDGKRWWITIDTLRSGYEYAFQYLIDANIRIADPYSEKILDPHNDGFISEDTYPNLKEYPHGKTSNIVGVFQTAQADYNWEIADFNTPKIDDLVIYELHVQNFTEAGNIKAVTDTLDYLERLGINAIELMPINEFEGNVSWGYNPSFYTAFDKIYGTKNDLKKFVDECHKRGIAVIIDMVLNHSFSQSPLVQMYWNGSSVTSDNPWYNVSCPHSNWCWGHDFNHESAATEYFVDRVNKYWLKEYNVDGYRFDFTKGFTNTVDANAWGPDASRVAILKRMSDAIWAEKEDAFVIFEHLADNAEEKELANYGIMLWGNNNYEYAEASMGYPSNLSKMSYKNLGWNDPHLVGYMESHDEERMMFKNINYGAHNDIYDIRDTAIGLQRVEAAAAFFFPIPGPKMIWEWEELGYDHSINRCTDGSISDNCRLAPKPIEWNYYNIPERNHLFKVFKALIDFKKFSICRTSDFDVNLTQTLKRIHLNGVDTSATIIGNFGLVDASIIPDFQNTGTWYDYMTGKSFEVNSTDDEILLNPGEYHIYTNVKFPTPVLPDAPSNIYEIRADTRISVYPNPAINNIINMGYSNMNQEPVNFSLYNLSGQLLQEEHYILENSGTINHKLNTFPKGILIYQIRTENGITNGKIINQ